jgi:tetratricopeptide (TPR) repeat protein
MNFAANTLQIRRSIEGAIALLALIWSLSGGPAVLAQERLLSGTASAASLPASLDSGNPPPPSTELGPEQIGDLHMAHHEYQEAIEAYHRAPSKSAELWNKLGIANQQMFNQAEAQKSYEASLSLDPKNPDVINNLATIYYSEKDYNKAVKLYKKAIKYNPKSALIYKNLGTAYLAQNKLKQGWDSFQTALQLDPKAFEGSGHYHIGEPTPNQQLGAMNYYLAKSYMLAGLKERAVDYLRMALDEGFTDRRKLLTGNEFSSLFELPAFQRLIDEGQSQYR